MTQIRTAPEHVCFGSKPEFLTLPIINLPPDTTAVRRKVKEKEIAKAYVKTTTTFQEWYLAWSGKESLKLCCMVCGKASQ